MMTKPELLAEQMALHTMIVDLEDGSAAFLQTDRDAAVLVISDGLREDLILTLRSRKNYIEALLAEAVLSEDAHD